MSEPINIPVTEITLMARMNTALRDSGKHVLWDQNRNEFVLLDVKKGTPINMSALALEMNCRAENEVVTTRYGR